MLLSIQNNSLFKDLPNPKISMLAIALHFWKSFMCKRLSYCPMSICSRSAWAKVQHLFWSYSNSKPTASGCSLVGGESGEMGHSGPAPRLNPCRGDCSYCPGNLSTRGFVIIVSAFSSQRNIKIYFWNIHTNMHQDPIQSVEMILML